ncbi:MAG TPA: hypothetical protein VGP22_08765 [Albitalea sp.]|nr:hypothetical protein [Albitalea sp.]
MGSIAHIDGEIPAHAGHESDGARQDAAACGERHRGIPELEVAYCVDAHGRRYTIDRRSAVSISALSEGMRLHVRAAASGLVNRLVYEDE